MKQKLILLVKIAVVLAISTASQLDQQGAMFLTVRDVEQLTPASKKMIQMQQHQCQCEDF